MGNPDGPRTLSQDLYWRVLRKQMTITGTWNSSYGGENSDWEEAVRAMADGKLKSNGMITRLLNGDELPTGLEIMRDVSEPYCRIAVKF